MGGDLRDNWEDSEDENSKDIPQGDAAMQLLQKISENQNFLLAELATMKCRRRKFWKKLRFCKLIKLLAVIACVLYVGNMFYSDFTRKPPTETRRIPKSVRDRMWMAEHHEQTSLLLPNGKWMTMQNFGPWRINVDVNGDVWDISLVGVTRYRAGSPVELIQSGGWIYPKLATYDGQRVFYTCSDCTPMEGSDGRKWIQLDGNLKHISVGDGKSVWGLDSKNQIWKYDLDGKNKERVPGKLRHLCVVSDDIIYGVDMSSRLVKWKSGQWVGSYNSISGPLLKVAATSSRVFVLKKIASGQYAWFMIGSKDLVQITDARSSPSELIVRPRHVKNTSLRPANTGNKNEDIPTSPPPATPQNIDRSGPASKHVLVYSKLTSTNHHDIFVEKHGETELIATFPTSLRHVSVSDDLVTLVIGKKVYFQSWADRQYALQSNRMYDDDVGAFLTKKRSWFLERRVLTVDTTGSCFVEGKCAYYDEKRNSPTFHSYRFDAMDVSHDGSHAWGLAADDSIYEWDSGLMWKKRSGKLVQISVGSPNHVWGINRRGLIFEYVGRDNWRHVAWNVSRGKPSAVRVGKHGHVVLLTKEGMVYQYDRSGNKWIHLSEYKDIQHLYLL